jgi:hypothetical protein
MAGPGFLFFPLQNADLPHPKMLYTVTACSSWMVKLGCIYGGKGMDDLLLDDIMKG